MTTSQPWLSSQTASATIVADDITTAPVARTRSTSSGAGRPKWKLTTSGRQRSTSRQASSSNGCLGGPDDARARSTPSSRRSARAIRTTRRARRRDLGCHVAEEVDVQRRVRRPTELVDLPGELFARSASPRAANRGRRPAPPRRPAQHRSRRPSALARWATRFRAGRSAHHRRTHLTTTLTAVVRSSGRDDR